MNHPFVHTLIRWSVLALGVTLAAELVPGIRCDDWMTLLAVVAILTFLNAVLKPLLMLVALPFILLTLGLGVVVINAFLFLLVDRLVQGFHVASFGTAFWGALVVSLTNVAFDIFTQNKYKQTAAQGPRVRSAWGQQAPRGPAEPEPRKKRPKDDDVIDI